MAQTEDEQAVQRLSEAYGQITAELGKVIVGQQQVIEKRVQLVLLKALDVIDTSPTCPQFAHKDIIAQPLGGDQVLRRFSQSYLKICCNRWDHGAETTLLFCCGGDRQNPCQAQCLREPQKCAS